MQEGAIPIIAWGCYTIPLFESACSTLCDLVAWKTRSKTSAGIDFCSPRWSLGPAEPPSDPRGAGDEGSSSYTGTGAAPVQEWILQFLR